MSEPAQTTWRGWVAEIIAAFPTSRDDYPGSAAASIPDRLLVIWIALARHANEDGIAWPSLTSLEAITGKDRRNLRRYLREGETRTPPLWSRVETARKSTRETTRYQVLSLGVNLPPIKRDGLGVKAHTTGGKSTPSLGVNLPARTKPLNKAIEQQQQEPDAAADVAVEKIDAEPDSIRRALVAAGITEPARGRLVAAMAASLMTPTQAAEMVRNKAAACKVAGKRGGVLIAEIEASIEQAQAQAQRREESRVGAAADAARRSEQDAQDRKVIAAQAAEREAFISTLTGDEYEKLKAEAIKENPHMRALWEQSKGSRGLHISMHDIHKRQAAAVPA